MTTTINIGGVTYNGIVSTAANSVDDFIRKELHLWGYEGVEAMLDSGLFPLKVDGKWVWSNDGIKSI